MFQSSRLSYIFLTQENYALINNKSINGAKALYYRTRYAPELGSQTPVAFFRQAHREANNLIQTTYGKYSATRNKQTLKDFVENTLTTDKTEGSANEIFNEIITLIFGRNTNVFGGFNTKGLTLNKNNSNSQKVTLNEIKTVLERIEKTLQEELINDPTGMIGDKTISEMQADLKNAEELYKKVRKSLEGRVLVDAGGNEITITGNTKLANYISDVSEKNNETGKRTLKGEENFIGLKETGMLHDILNSTWVLVGSYLASYAVGAAFEIRTAIQSELFGMSDSEQITYLNKLKTDVAAQKSSGKGVDALIKFMNDNLKSLTGKNRYAGLNVKTSKGAFAPYSESDKIAGGSHGDYLEGLREMMGNGLKLEQFWTDEYGNQVNMHGGTWHIAGRQMKTDVVLNLSNNQTERLNLKNYDLSGKKTRPIELVGETSLFAVLAYASMINTAYLGHFMNLYSSHYVYSPAQEGAKKNAIGTGGRRNRYMVKNYHKQTTAPLTSTFSEAKESFFKILLMQAIGGRDSELDSQEKSVWTPSTLFVVNDNAGTGFYIYSVKDLIMNLTVSDLTGSGVELINSLKAPIFDNKPRPIQWGSDKNSVLRTFGLRTGDLYSKAREKKISLGLNKNYIANRGAGYITGK